MMKDYVKTPRTKVPDLERHADQTPGKRDSSGPPQHGVIRDERGQEQPVDKKRAQEVNRRDEGGDPPGYKTEHKA